MDRNMDFLISAGRLLPVTVIGAIILFLVKEGIEASRRFKMNARKRKVVHRLISDEIERNYWTIKSLRNIVSEIGLAVKDPDAKLEISSGFLGQLYFRYGKGEDGYSQSPVQKVHSEALTANLLTLAEIDQPIFESALEASDALKELDHVRQSIVTHIAGDFEHSFLEGLVDYSNDEINDCEKTLSGFYKSLTGRALEEHRLR